MKFRIFSDTQGETIASAQVFYQTQLPFYLEEVEVQALAYLATRYTADLVKSPLSFDVVVDDGATIMRKVVQRADVRWPW